MCPTLKDQYYKCDSGLARNIAAAPAPTVSPTAPRMSGWRSKSSVKVPVVSRKRLNAVTTSPRPIAIPCRSPITVVNAFVADRPILWALVLTRELTSEARSRAL